MLTKGPYRQPHPSRVVLLRDVRRLWPRQVIDVERITMLKRIVPALAAVGLTISSVAASTVAIGSATLTPPNGWREVKKDDGRVVFRTPDDRQQATVSLMRFGAVPSFQDFKLLCAHRLEAEKKGSPEAFIEPEVPEPFARDGRFGIFYSGGEKATGRVFSCYFSCAGKELITVYVEAIGLAPKDHLASFEAFVGGLKRK